VRRAVLLVLALALLAPAATLAHPPRHKRHVVRQEEPVRTRHGRHRKPPTKPPKPPVKPPTTPPPTTPPPKPLARLQVTAREYSLTLSRTAVAAGTVSVELDNFGQDPHDLRVERTGSPSTGFSFTLAKPRTVSSQKLDLAPGDWKLYCTLPGHEALGMTARITVTD
jgi:plastocyanin